MAGRTVSHDLPRINHEIISRAEAKARGLKRYFTGEPCAHGHVALRCVGANNECVECKRIRDAKYSAANKLSKSAYNLDYRKRTRDRRIKQKLAWLEANPEYNREYFSRYYAEKREYFAEYRKANRDKRNQQKREWQQRNSEHVREYARQSAKRLKSENLNYRISCALRTRLAVAVREGKGGSAVRDLGCAIEEFRKHLEAQFLPGMSWDNWGRKGWHIDHIKPLASFDLSDPAQVSIACHFSNLRPLWAFENLSKGAG